MMVFYYIRLTAINHILTRFKVSAGHRNQNVLI